MKRNEMVETAKPDVQIILSIKEGKGFEQVLQPTLLIGTLNGHSLETDRIEPSANPQYATDLIWETNKAALRKMRSGQAPLKLECFALKENGCKEKLGYIVLSIRSAHVTLKYRDLSPKTNWYKLLGLRNDLKIQKPEILLTLRVEDWKNDSNPIIEIKSVMTNEDDVSQNDKIIPYLHPDEQLIQLGSPNDCQELFLLNITAVYIENLHLLLPEPSNKDSVVYFSYRVLENDVELKPFEIQSENPHFLHEKVVVRIRSSLSVLKHYLQSESHLLIFLKHENNIIAESAVNLESLIVTDNLQEFLKCSANTSTIHERCFLTKQNLEKLVESQQPDSHLDLQLKLQYIGNNMNIVHNSDTAINSNNHIIPQAQYHNEENTSNASQKCSEIESHRNPSGDFGKLNFNSIPEIKNATECRNKQSSDCRCLKHQVTRDACSCSCDATLCKCINKNYIKGAESYHCYCLHISLMTITSLSAKLSKRQIEFRFHHPKAEITSTMRATMPFLSDEKMKLQDIGCQFHFISASNEIKQLLQSFPPQISMYDINEDAGPLSLFTLDVKPLFHQDKPECQYKLPLYDADRNKIGEIDVILKLENCGSHFVLKKETAEQNLGPPIMDDSLAYKIVDELETWKERQKEMFKAELKKKEERHLNMLNEEWRKQKENLESKLACSVEQCKMLANSLNNATEDLRTRRLKSLENETRLIKANEDLQWRYENKLQELKDSMLTMQNDLGSKITKLEEKKIALEAQVEILLFENENLKSSIGQQKDELQIYHKGALAQDQTESLQQELKILEKKLENAQKGKTFFKEQWGRAVREIHRMKVDYQQAMQVQIKNSKEDLAEILSADTAALTEDQILLNELQREIDIIKPRQSFAPKETHDRVFAPADVYSKVSWNDDKVFDKSEEDERLQALREERDTLLRTGSYTNDDIVIKKLNSEIRSLLVK